MRALTGILTTIYLTAHRLGVRGVPRLTGTVVYRIMQSRHRRLSHPVPATRDATSPTPSPVSSDTVRIAGLTWHIPHDDRKPGSLSDRLLRGHLPLAEILRTRAFSQGGVMIDIGANIGTTAIPRLLLGDVDRVYGVEPNPTNYACLERTIADNGLGDLVVIDRLALGAADGEAELLVASRMGRRRLVKSGPTRHTTVRVPISRLDTWSDRLGGDLARVRYVKCDTQGWESHVVSGGQQLLSRREIVWEIEICPALLESAGSSLDELCVGLAPHFTWFVNLRADDETLDRQPIAQLAATVRQTIAGPRNYTNVILGH